MFRLPWQNTTTLQFFLVLIRHSSDRMNDRSAKVYARIRLCDVEDNLASVGSIGDWCSIEHVRCRVEGAAM